MTSSDHGSTRRAFVSDSPSLDDPSDSIVLQIAARYLDNCAAAYESHTYKAIAVMNIRTTAIPAAMTDAAWSRYSLGAEYNVKDPGTQQPAVRNSFWSRQFAVPSGIFGLARAQNASCAFVRM